MSNVRIVIISDTHGRHRDLTVPEGDILIHAGDFMTSGKQFQEITDFNHWLGGLPHPTKLVVAGNHDCMFETDSYFSRCLLTHANYLENSRYVAHGLKFYGSPYTPEYMNWAFMRDRGDPMARIWKGIPSDVDVLITHGPPYGILDKWEGKHVGCEALRDEVMARKIPYHCFGHIHADFGIRYWEERMFINASVLDADKNPTQPAVILDIEVGNDKWNL